MRSSHVESAVATEGNDDAEPETRLGVWPGAARHLRSRDPRSERTSQRDSSLGLPMAPSWRARAVDWRWTAFVATARASVRHDLARRWLSSCSPTRRFEAAPRLVLRGSWLVPRLFQQRRYTRAARCCRGRWPEQQPFALRSAGPSLTASRGAGSPHSTVRVEHQR